ncbi:MAG: cytidylate kinase-like family protein [Paludibacteraceae bacterium]|nr:cytidylate kinase-like family protein [Paludibacteraceae bacterium]
MIITVGRQYAAGGRDIAKRLGEAFNLVVYDSKLLSAAAAESGISAEHFSKADEQTHYARATKWLSSHVPLFFGAYGANQGLTNQTLFQLQSDAIRQIAEQGDCIFIGRCADYILRERTDMVSVFITADEEERIEHIMCSENVNRDKALKIIRAMDRQRADYYNFYTEKTWGEAKSYDLCINCTRLGHDKTADFIVDFIKKRFKE